MLGEIIHGVDLQLGDDWRGAVHEVDVKKVASQQ